MHSLINSRQDLEALRGTSEFAEAIAALAGSMTIRVDVAEYPSGYGDPDYNGATIEPVWEDREDLTTIERLGYTKAEILAELEAIGP